MPLPLPSSFFPISCEFYSSSSGLLPYQLWYSTLYFSFLPHVASYFQPKNMSSFCLKKQTLPYCFYQFFSAKFFSILAYIYNIERTCWNADYNSVDRGGAELRFWGMSVQILLVNRAHFWVARPWFYDSQPWLHSRNTQRGLEILMPEWHSKRFCPLEYGLWVLYHNF
jgi:hypothetical protein